MTLISLHLCISPLSVHSATNTPFRLQTLNNVQSLKNHTLLIFLLHIRLKLLLWPTHSPTRTPAQDLDVEIKDYEALGGRAKVWGDDELKNDREVSASVRLVSVFLCVSLCGWLSVCVCECLCL